MPTSFTTGAPRIRLLDATGATIKTLYLPPPVKGGASLAWQEKSVRQELLDGSPRLRRLGFIPVLKLKWSVFDDRSIGRIPIGSADGNQADFATFLALLDAIPGRLKISPGPSAGGFTALVTVHPREAPKGRDFATEVEVEFTGRDVLPSKLMGVF